MIPWQKYDPDNPPSTNGYYIVWSDQTDEPYAAYLDGFGRWIASGYDCAEVFCVTHFAPINLPREDETRE